MFDTSGGGDVGWEPGGLRKETGLSFQKKNRKPSEREEWCFREGANVVKQKTAMPQGVKGKFNQINTYTWYQKEIRNLQN